MFNYFTRINLDFQLHVDMMDASDPSLVFGPFVTMFIVNMVVTPVRNYSRIIMIPQELVVMMVKMRMVLMVMAILMQPGK